ncbi:MAG: hypothetical protein DID92_2727744731 [Candidatus Nitrotoga sp. SPKER]|nr:MAG: hypothetical protein DID92_2727744731 [Candidatus Nitrotoga sp. SPKER]
MYPVQDVDAILLLSLSVAAKRRPADLTGIITAIDLAHDAIPSGNKLSDAFARMSAYGLVIEIEGGYALSSDAQKMMVNQRKKDDTEKKLFRLKEHLAGYHLKGEHAAIQIHPDQLLAAIKAFQASKKTAGKNVLRDKPKTVWIPTKELANFKGKPFPSKRRKG